jgi:uncharacterized membrane protein YdjX (TVP38/TMEM64 family)
MTANDPLPPPPEMPPPGPPTPPPVVFNPGLLIVGLLIALPVGGVANIVAGLMGMSTNNKALAFLVGIIPGAIFVALSRLAPKNGFGHGLLIGGCIVALIGGACGASMVGTSFH